MVVGGSINSININGSFGMKDQNGVEVFKVSRSKYMSGKIHITNSKNGIAYFGEIIHNAKGEEFVLYEDESEILRIKQVSALGLPKLEIISSFGDFSTKFSLRKRNLTLLDGEKEVLTFSGTPSNYKMDIDDSSNTFYLMSIAYGITALLNPEN